MEKKNKRKNMFLTDKILGNIIFQNFGILTKYFKHFTVQILWLLVNLWKISAAYAIFQLCMELRPSADIYKIAISKWIFWPLGGDIAALCRRYFRSNYCIGRNSKKCAKYRFSGRFYRFYNCLCTFIGVSH